MKKNIKKTKPENTIGKVIANVGLPNSNVYELRIEFPYTEEGNTKRREPHWWK